jgi:RNA polymerase sigma-70 factor, ECF subfamily
VQPVERQFLFMSKAFSASNLPGESAKFNRAQPDSEYDSHHVKELAQVAIDPDMLARYRLKLRYKVCYHLGSSCPDVDDVVQETVTRFLGAVRDEKIRNPESTPAFLSGICNNVIQEYRRRLWKEPLSDSDSPPERPAAPEADLLEMRQIIGVVMTELSQRDQDLLRAFFLEEKDKEEICRSMGLSDAQFRVALFRAKERFRTSYHKSVKRTAPQKH